MRRYLAPIAAVAQLWGLSSVEHDDSESNVYCGQKIPRKLV